ncbi:MAG: hypothetical protein ACOYMB_02050 [Patescibacteria group bacterium]
MKNTLSKPVVAFCETYAGSTPSKQAAINACDEVGKILNSEKILFAVEDGGFFYSVYVEEIELENVKAITNKSNLEYWKLFFEQK